MIDYAEICIFACKENIFVAFFKKTALLRKLNEKQFFHTILVRRCKVTLFVQGVNPCLFQEKSHVE